jgi:hypothetical protein
VKAVAMTKILTPRFDSVASVYFQNGSSFDIAKVEGSPSYKQLMRVAVPNFDDTEPGESADAAYVGRSASDLGLSQSTLVPQPLSHYMPTWLGGHDRDVQVLTGMLKALKVAAEFHLDAPVCTAAAALPFYSTTSYYQILSNAFASLSLRLTLPRLSPAGVWALRAYGLAGYCDYCGLEQAPEKLIITIDYSRAAFTAFLVHEECSVFEYRRVVHDTRLGLDGIEHRSEATWGDVEHALRKLTVLPLKDGNGEGLKHISNIVLIGESARDSRLQNAIQNVLGERYNTLEIVENAADPVFAAARGVAWHTLIHSDWSDDGCTLPVCPR